MYSCRAYSAYKQAVAPVKEAFTPAVQISVPTHITTEYTTHSRLPDINLPTFSGDYSQWPQFQKLLISLILDNAIITDVEVLHSYVDA